MVAPVRPNANNLFTPLNKQQYNQSSYALSGANQYQQSMSPASTGSIAPAMSMEDPVLNVANQFLLQDQGGLTESMALGSLGNTSANKGMTLDDKLNFGLSAAQTLGGMYYQNKVIGQNQQQLDLAQSQYSDLRSDKAALNSANRERAATAKAQMALNG